MATVNVLTETETLNLIGQTFVGATVVNGELILTTNGGNTVNAGNVKGSSAPYPTASAVSFAPASGITSTTLQTALAELGGDVQNLNTLKADKSELRKVRTGTVTQPGGATSSDRIGTFSFSPTTYFTEVPDLVVLPIPHDQADGFPNPTILLYYSIHHVTTSGFQITTRYMQTNSFQFYYVAVQS